jgi:hypothetical protein
MTHPDADPGVWCDVGGLRTIRPGNRHARPGRPIKDQELLAAAVSMRAEMTVRRVPDDRGSARYLIADATASTGRRL